VDEEDVMKIVKWMKSSESVQTHESIRIRQAAIQAWPICVGILPSLNRIH